MVRRLFDADEITHAIRAVIMECPERNWTPEPISAGTLIEGFAHRGASARIYGFYSEKGGPKGFLIGVILVDPSTGEKTGSEFAWFVVPSFRGTGAAMALLNRFEADAKAEGATCMLAGFSPYVWVTKMDKLYQHLGYKQHLITVRKTL